MRFRHNQFEKPQFMHLHVTNIESSGELETKNPQHLAIFEDLFLN